MVQQAKHPGEAEADLGNPGELLSLDVASYAAGLASGNENGESTERRISEASWDESRPHTLAELSPIETLREVEAWIAAQDARTRTNNRVFAELQAARADAEARADNLALELEVAQKALHTALCRANEAERADFAATIDKLHAPSLPNATRPSRILKQIAQLGLPRSRNSPRATYANNKGQRRQRPGTMR